ncbi:MAG TPA: AI-2E family transporter [Bacteroidales bacterium]|nr:AI-2E family transporter [Bacteroidota bacterium]HJN05104.1 AI-2E family transporter [Bacteroidales bacterium]|tara:strand:- start:708 stop:1796 length:1089 start_codon:yes stop_codon:yes gene_type:complete
MKDTKTTNILLLILVIPLIFYLLKILSFIFIPLILAMFIALLFLPLMRWLNKKRIPKSVSVIIVILIIIGAFKIGGELIKLSSKEILASDVALFEKTESKLVDLIVSIEDFFGIERVQGDNVLVYYFQKTNIIKNFGLTLGFIQKTLSMTLMTAFFIVLLLAGSINFQKLLNSTIFKQKYSSVKTFMKIENDIIKFIKVKFVISLFTGIGFGLACLIFGVSFPIFWGLFAFAINFIQMIGSIISVVVLSLFAFVELDPTGILLFFIIVITGVQVIMGGVLEPVFMGKSFSINVITILIMLMFWGYIWGIPGLIMAIPITVFLKVVLEQSPKTKIIAELMAGPGRAVSKSWKKKNKSQTQPSS